MSNPSFTAEDLVFLRAILDVPEDRNTWLIYADWLEDRSDPRAEFLRLMVARSLMSDDDPARPETEARLTQLRGELDSNWMMMFDPAPVGNCRPCRWDDMIATDVPDIRRCHRCKQAIIYCHTLEEARQYASCGQDVALSTRIPAAEIAADPAFRPPPPPPPDSDEFELTLEEFLGAEPPAAPPPPEPPRRAWWKFW
jgi:uncharacterized protein (TIGR02996 family)